MSKPYLGLQDTMWFVNDANDLSGGSGDFASAASYSPTASGASLSNVLYLTEPGDSNAISVNDIHQGSIGDCFLLSAIGEIARVNPNFIKSMIHDNGNGSQTITLDKVQGLSVLGATQVKVTDVFDSRGVNGGPTQDVVGNQKEIWVQVLEKGVATLDDGVNGSLTPISYGGSPVQAMEQLTGKAAGWMSPSSLTLSTLVSMVNANDLIVFDTKNSSSLPYGLVGNHAYMFEGIVGSGSTAAVHLGNPWGFDQPQNVPLSALSKSFAEVDYGHT